MGASFYEIASKLKALKLDTVEPQWKPPQQTQDVQKPKHGQILPAVEKNAHQAHTAPHEVGDPPLWY